MNMLTASAQSAVVEKLFENANDFMGEVEAVLTDTQFAHLTDEEKVIVIKSLLSERKTKRSVLVKIGQALRG